MAENDEETPATTTDPEPPVADVPDVPLPPGPPPEGEISEPRLRGWLEIAVPAGDDADAEARAMRVAVGAAILYDRYCTAPEDRPTRAQVGARPDVDLSDAEVEAVEDDLLDLLKTEQDRWIGVARGLLEPDHPLAKAIFGSTHRAEEAGLTMREPTD